MSSKPNKTTFKPIKTTSEPIFRSANYAIIATACIIIVAGLVLMSGNGSTETTFQPGIFSARRIVIAPLVCFIGYVAIIGGIMWHDPHDRQHG